MSKTYWLFMVAPKGHEMLATVVVAKDEEQACKQHANMFGEFDVPYTVINLTEKFAVQGFNVNISKHIDLGTFH